MKLEQIFNCVAVTAFLTLAAACGSGTNGAEQSHDSHGQHEEAAAPGAKKALSPRTAAMANIGDTHVHIDYSSPGVRGRVIWGGLVAYGQVWVTGAHQATSIDFSRDVRIGGQEVPAGKYALFTIPGESEWVVIINKNYEQHLADEYDEGEDVVRLRVTPEALDLPVESLTYEVKDNGANSGEVSIQWEKVKVAFPIEVRGE